MRVISGSAGGRKLRDVNIDIRPTGDKVKESIFNIIQFDIEGRRVLDLFAGSGQFGIEALSRGAVSAEFVDKNPNAGKLITENLRLCGFLDLATVHVRDAVKFLEKSSSDCTFDIIFIDPPYNTSLAADALDAVVRFDKLNSNGIIIYETSIDGVVPNVSLPYVLSKEYRYGSVKVVRFDRYPS